MSADQAEGNSFLRTDIFSPDFFFSDLRAFEQRLVDCVAALQPEAFKWKGRIFRKDRNLSLLFLRFVVLLIVVIVWNVMTGLGWLMDARGSVFDTFPRMYIQTDRLYIEFVLKMGFLESLWDHKAFSCGLIVLFVLLVTNQYQKALAPQMYGID